MDGGGTESRGRESLCRQLRCLPSGQRQGSAWHFPAAGRIEDRQWSQGGADQHCAERQDTALRWRRSSICRTYKSRRWSPTSATPGATRQATSSSHRKSTNSENSIKEETMAAVHDHDVAHAHDHHPSGMMRWVTTTNHKDIGTHVPVVLLHHVPHRRRDGADHPRRAVPAGPAVRPARSSSTS